MKKHILAAILFVVAGSACAGNDPIVYVTQTGHKYHRAHCRYLSHSERPIHLSEAVREGYTPCKICQPPVMVHVRHRGQKAA